MVKPAEEIIRGNPVSSSHEPVPTELVDWMEERDGKLAPLCILALGASGAAGHANATGGNRVIPSDSVFMWDCDMHDAGGAYVAGTQFNLAAFGTEPLAFNSGLSNSLPLQAALRLNEIKGRPVYVVVLAMSAHDLESLITSTVRTANGWSLDGADEDLTLHYSNMTTALAAVPGSPSRFDYALWYQFGDIAADGKTVYQAKFAAMLDGLVTANLTSEDATQVVAYRTAPGRTNRDLHDQAISSESAKRTNLAIGETHGAELSGDGIHYTGDGVTTLGRRGAASLLGSGPNTASSLVLADGTLADGDAFLSLNLSSGDSGDIEKVSSDGSLRINMNTNILRTRFISIDTSDALWVTATAYTSGDVRRYGDNIYQATTTATSGATAPTHTSGTVSDGGVSWLWLRDIQLTQINFNNSGLSILGGADRYEAYARGTPTLTLSDAASGGNDATFSANDVRYAQEGREFTIYAEFEGVTTAGMTAGNHLFCTGLSIAAAANGISFPAICSVEYVGFGGASYSQIVAKVIAATDHIKFFSQGSGVAQRNIIVSDLTSGSANIQFTIRYRTVDPLA